MYVHGKVTHKNYRWSHTKNPKTFSILHFKNKVKLMAKGGNTCSPSAALTPSSTFLIHSCRAPPSLSLSQVAPLHAGTKSNDVLVILCHHRCVLAVVACCMAALPMPLLLLVTNIIIVVITIAAGWLLFLFYQFLVCYCWHCSPGQCCCHGSCCCQCPFAAWCTAVLPQCPACCCHCRCLIVVFLWFWCCSHCFLKQFAFAVVSSMLLPLLILSH